MYKFFVALVVVLASNNLAHSAPIDAQQWECAVNLHQGDNGTLSIERTGDSVSGMINIKRNDSVFENEVSGRWVNNEINLKRLLGESSNESMTGIVVALGTKKVKIGGRFSAEYQGVWSADCDLVSTSALEKEPSADADTASKVEPSTSIGVIPNNPTSKDRIKFSARASHPDGIESVSFILGKKKIHTCAANECDFTYGPISKGKYSWRVEALSKSGVKNTEGKNELLVSAAQANGTCTISGIATGTAAELSEIYLIKLFGPNDNTVRASKEFQDGRYQFTNLPEGRYTLTVDTRADKSVLATPEATSAKCLAQENVTVNFDFR